MRGRSSKKRGWVSAVVITVAGCGGTGDAGPTTGECCHNPPPIFTFQGLEPGDRVTRDDDGSCSHFVAANGSARDVECPAALPQPGTIWRNGETCSFMPNVHCPPPSEATCNPPPPMPVACPTN